MKLLILLTVMPFFWCKSAEEWKSRSIYQILTDRFAKTVDDHNTCSDYDDYCGGSFLGIVKNLDYIENMGFNAIWISPTSQNQPKGYHGYWTKNLYIPNDRFGSKEDLHVLIEECHKRDIWIMVDIVVNHMGYLKMEDSGVITTENNHASYYDDLIPFNNPEYYNEYLECNTMIPRDQDHIEKCWIWGMPDIKQDHPYVKQTLLSWIENYINEWGFDGLRLDTVQHVPQSFWKDFSKTSGVFTLGEILDYDLHYLADYQQNFAVDSLLNYPLYSTLRYVFQNGGSCYSLSEYLKTGVVVWRDADILGNFVDSHDQPRFLETGSENQFRAALTFTLCVYGIPIMYYGDEQMYRGGSDPYNREPLWPNYNQHNDLYKHIKTVNTFRRSTRFWNFKQIESYVNDKFYAFYRGIYIFAFTNSDESQTYTIETHPYSDDTILCNLFHLNDVIPVKYGRFTITLTNGESKILYPCQKNVEQTKQTDKIVQNVASDLVANIFSSV